MIKPIYCKFNMDNACVELIFRDGTMISIYTLGVADEVEDNWAQHTELEWLVYNEPLTYVQLVLSGDMVHYLRGTPLHKLEE